MDMLANNQTKQKLTRKYSFVSEKRKQLLFYISIIALPLVQFLIFYIYINFDSFVLAFQEYSFEDGYVLVGFNNFKQIFQDFGTNLSLKYSIINSWKLFLWTFVMSALVAIFFSYYIYKKYMGHGIFKVLLYIPQIVGGVALVIIYKFFTELAIPEISGIVGDRIEGLLSNSKTTLPTILFFTISISFGTQVLVYSSAMSGISDSLIESAELDGITPMKELFYIVLPSIWSTFVTFIVASVMGIFTNQMALYTFYGTDAPSSLSTFGYYLYRRTVLALPGDYPYLSALGLLATVVAVPITIGTRWALTKFGPSRD